LATALLLVAYVLLPALVLWLCARVTLARRIGAVILCYLVGIAVGNSGLAPAELKPALVSLQDVAVALALPLLLFSSNVRRWVPTAGRALLAFGFAVLAVGLVTTLGWLALRARPDAWQIAGMSFGVYTGGTPNLASAAKALEVSNDTFIVFHTYDTVVSLAYILFMASMAQRLFVRIGLLRPYRPTGSAADAAGLEVESLDAFRDMLRPRRAAGLGLALAAAAGMMGVGYLAGRLVSEEARTAVAILALTSLGIGASLIPTLHRIQRTFQLGFYVLLIFCLAVGTQARLDSLVAVQWDLAGFVALVIFGSLGLQALLCRLFRLDVDTALVTHVSAICSPPFVPVVTAGLRNPELLPAGITTGIIGYALGNYLAIGLAYLLRSCG